MMPRFNLPRLRPTVAPRPYIAQEPPDPLPTKPESTGVRPRPYIAQEPPDPLPTRPEPTVPLPRPYIAQPPPDPLPTRPEPTEPSTLITGGEIMDITAPGINMGIRQLQDEGSKVSSGNLRRNIRKLSPSLISARA